MVVPMTCLLYTSPSTVSTDKRNNFSFIDLETDITDSLDPVSYTHLPSLRSGLETAGQEISLPELTGDFLGFRLDGDF